MWIRNVSMSAVINGDHPLDDNGTVLIQIQDIGTWKFAEPAAREEFVAIHQFEFMDADDADDDCNITEQQAEQIAGILKTALTDGHSVLVHCHMGLCRSGAVAEVGVMLGFDDTHTVRHPNILVKNRLRKALGLSVDYSEIFRTVL